jgi:hypothetical protein
MVSQMKWTLRATGGGRPAVGIFRSVNFEIGCRASLARRHRGIDALVLRCGQGSPGLCPGFLRVPIRHQT